MKSFFLFSISLFFVLLAAAQGNKGLVGHWNFNGNANDISGHSLHGTIHGATLDTGYTGVANTAYKFNGVDNHINIPFDSLMNVDSFSICALIRIDGFYAGPCQNNIILIRGRNGWGYHYEMGYGDNQYDNNCATHFPDQEYPYVWPNAYYGSFDSQWYAKPSLDSNKWYCLTGTYDGDSMRMYINGIMTRTVYSPNEYTPADSDGIYIGYWPGSGTKSPTNWLNGVIDDVRLYNRALSSSEVGMYCDSTEKPMPNNVATQSITPQISIYPNPASNRITVQLPNSIGKAHIYIINTLGESVLDRDINGDIGYVDVSKLATGVYIIKIAYNNQIVYKRLLKQ